MVSRSGLAPPFLCALLFGAGAAPPTWGAAVTVSPSSISNDYVGAIILTATGLAPGQAVVIEKH